ncbi:MAG: hypothetical protein EZS28_006898 [Streblomastix strix]|uniref:Uncharacterized protein n=1 Tax=Streblomastix strix TaxID=222440 RepID=A0A5J4WTY0_9EUKA|nr:MAG: hypothetical protein EZS28_006898 [Streblomastix strix]
MSYTPLQQRWIEARVCVRDCYVERVSEQGALSKVQRLYPDIDPTFSFVHKRYYLHRKNDYCCFPEKRVFAARNPRWIQEVQAFITDHPHSSLRGLARGVQHSAYICRLILKQDLHVRSLSNK